MSGKVVVSKEEVLHYAKLCRISLTEADVERLQKDVNEILEYFNTVRSLQLDVEPMVYVTGFSEALREDEPAETLSEDDVFKNAGEKDEKWFVSGQVLG
ncbi:MAG: Asp-tRNA(Asn)/Glu-tRNA(Gln) amidotransferase subunit GatC [Candidatus Brockarchaeota archaeon]|nr:Asp-tRNA(Asn)/Glu-tRNA(Gln) amidotransferase subunit GatC [Candidatus Brockarchaeota archaeon]MBO3833073.1 Asp-tRNA(Asn)/Glu-tRNA(Gln) amidotransferase subunit GatC [Candidatus Brockarchaeota archaeon]MBO3841237.1 Asp-tRNA(Asn)/Glu-tRNA(Gln) amidotransferase subunit GatC [Candidatus Brockarchaeota archaeon]